MSTDDRHILVDQDGTEWLRDPRFDSEQRLKDMTPELANQYRRELPTRFFAPGYNPMVLHVFADQIDFDGPEDDPESRFLAAVMIHVWHDDVSKSTTMMHLQGIAVKQDDDGIQQAENDEYAEDLDNLTALYEPDHPYYTATLPNGRSYVVYGVPYC